MTGKETKMLCEFQRLIYPTSPQLVLPGTYTVASYVPCERVLDTSGKLVTQIKAVGYCLPTAEKLRYKLSGHWIKHPRHGLQFEVEGYEEVISHTKEGIIGYLASGQIKGVGPKIAEKIYDAFGQDTLDILDHEPEKLMTIRGISAKKLEKIREHQRIGENDRRQRKDMHRHSHEAGWRCDGKCRCNVPFS